MVGPKVGWGGGRDVSTGRESLLLEDLVKIYSSELGMGFTLSLP